MDDDLTPMNDPPLRPLADAVARIQRPACWLAKLVTRAALVAGLAGAYVWWRVAGDDIADWWQGTAKALLWLVLLLAPALWLLNVRFALVSLVELPDKLGDIARRRGGQLRGRPAERPKGGAIEAARTVRDLVQDYGEVTGSWGLVAQLVAPTFWLFTAAALVAVPVLVIAALIAAIAA